MREFSSNICGLTTPLCSTNDRIQSVAVWQQGVSQNGPAKTPPRPKKNIQFTPRNCRNWLWQNTAQRNTRSGRKQVRRRQKNSTHTTQKHNVSHRNNSLNQAVAKINIPTTRYNSNCGRLEKNLLQDAPNPLETGLMRLCEGIKTFTSKDTKSGNTDLLFTEPDTLRISTLLLLLIKNTTTSNVLLVTGHSLRGGVCHEFTRLRRCLLRLAFLDRSMIQIIIKSCGLLAIVREPTRNPAI